MFNHWIVSGFVVTTQESVSVSVTVVLITPKFKVQYIIYIYNLTYKVYEF